MTVIIGFLCKDGIVVGSDSSATFGPDLAHRTIEQSVQKVL
jgi:20S proteasome alpha/beta subunit